jgi:hypothetical protein
MTMNPTPTPTPHLREMATEQEKARLRKSRVLSSKAKVSLYKDADPGRCPGITIQLGEDVRVYGVWEALLFVEEYEETRHYAPGAAMRAFLSSVRR